VEITMTERKYTQAELQYFAMMRGLTTEEQEERRIKQAEAGRAMTQEEILEQQIKMISKGEEQCQRQKHH
jgi:ABC-type Na+ transport system ATPase subunit NatA